MSLQKIFLIFFLLLQVGCASLMGRKQIVPFACSTPKCKIKITGEDFSTYGPGFLEVDREKEIHVTYEADGQKIEQQLETTVRVTESIAPNVVLGIFAGFPLGALGLLVDYYTGSLFQISNPPVAQFPTKEKDQIQIDRIVILPPAADDVFLSDESVAIIQQELKNRFPNAKIFVPEQFPKLFSKYGFSHEDQALDFEQKNKMHAELETDFVVYSDVKRSRKNSSQAQVSFEVFDVYRRNTIFSGTEKYESELDLESKKSWFATQAAKLLPSGVGVSYKQITTGGVGFDKTPEKIDWNAYAQGEDAEIFSYAEISGASSGLGSARSIGISLNNFDAKVGESSRVVGKWATDYTLNYTPYYLIERTSIMSLSGSRLDSAIAKRTEQYSIAAYIGPEFGVYSFAGYWFLNLMIGADFSYNQVSANSSFTYLQAPVRASIGWRIKASDNWLFGITTGYTAVSSDIFDKISQESSIAGKYAFDTVTQVSVNMALTYHLPETKKIGRRYLRPVAKN